MKKIGIILAALVITTFFVGAVAAMDQNNPPDQREKFREDCKVQGSGWIEYDKIIVDKEIAIDIEEHMRGFTGGMDVGDGEFAMTLTEILNEGVRLNHGNCTAGVDTMWDPIYGDDKSPVMTNFESRKMVQFDVMEGANGGLWGNASYSNPGFHGGMNAKVLEYYDVTSLQKDEVVKMTTTATFTRDCDLLDDEDWTRCEKYPAYNANELNFDTKNAFEGTWGTNSSWKKVCSKNIQHHQEFSGTFQVDKNLIFKEEVTGTCKEDWKGLHGDC